MEEERERTQALRRRFAVIRSAWTTAFQVWLVPWAAVRSGIQLTQLPAGELHMGIGSRLMILFGLHHHELDVLKL